MARNDNSAPDGYSGPRIVINPTTFKNEKDALCVAFDEGFRILMEMSAFEPVSEPTAEQRKFFSDTAYNDDEVQLRRTILARVCTLDTSVPRPTDSQIQEAVEFLESVLEMGACQNEWEQASVRKLLDMMRAVPVRTGGAKKPSAGGTEGDVGGGTATTQPVSEEEVDKVNANANDDGSAKSSEDATPPSQSAAQQPAATPGSSVETAGTSVLRAQDGGAVVTPGGINGKNADAVSAAANATTEKDYKDGNVWRDKNGQRIGDDAQYKQYQAAQKALAGTGAYYDAGVWRTKTGARIDTSQWAPDKSAAKTANTPAEERKGPTAMINDRGQAMTAGEAKYMLGRYSTGASMNQKQIGFVENYIKANGLDITRGGKDSGGAPTVSSAAKTEPVAGSFNRKKQAGKMSSI